MAGTGKLRLSRGDDPPPHVLLRMCYPRASGLLPCISFTLAALFFISFCSFFLLAYLSLEICLTIAQHESRSCTFREPGAEERLCEHAEAARQLRLYWSWPDGELSLIEISNGFFRVQTVPLCRAEFLY